MGRPRMPGSCGEAWGLTPVKRRKGKSGVCARARALTVGEEAPGMLVGGNMGKRPGKPVGPLPPEPQNCGPWRPWGSAARLPSPGPGGK